MENKYKTMTQQLRLTYSEEDVAGYIRWIIKSDAARDFWVEAVKQELLKQMMPVIYENGYPVDAVAKTIVLSLHSLIKSAEK